MAKIFNGLMGAISGKVGGVVGGRWKGVSYIRAYTVPGKSRTVLQAAQRDAFGAAVLHGKPFVGRVFQSYYNKFLPRESGLNTFVRNNIASVSAEGYLVTPIITQGPLYRTSTLAASEVAQTGVFNITWGTEHGLDGLDSDIVISFIRDAHTGQVAFAINSTRNYDHSSVGDATWHGRAAVEVGIIFIQMKTDSPTLCLKVSDSLCKPVS
jgi:hypothetical protein